MSLNVVLHPDVVDFLHTEVNIDLKNRVWECIKKLREQQFDAGIRIKKLKGFNKQVWEARINQASRILYTYSKSSEPESGQPRTYIAVQDICLDHDDVPRRARRNTPEAHWLDSEELTIFDSINSESLTNAEQDNIKNILKSENLENLQIDSEFVDELLGNIQWQVVESEEEWQQAIMQNDVNLSLKLSPEEYKLVNIQGNLLLSGGAGTGKTTVGLYRLCKSLETLPSGKRLYVSYNRNLAGKSEEQFSRLTINVGTNYVFQFKTIKDLCFEILASVGESLNPEDEVNYQVFEKLYSKLPAKNRPYPSTLVWDEIRGIIKGSHLHPNSLMLSPKEYQQLGVKRSSVMTKTMRDDVYSIAEWYQKELKKEGRFDEIDLARYALQVINEYNWEIYQLVVCDEVQDFTELQLRLLVSIVPSYGSLFFAGDLHQMISPSGFRWEELKSIFYNSKRKSTQENLKFNFRSVGSLVNLSNQVLKIRYRLLKEKFSEGEKPNINYGENARLISRPLDELRPSIGQLNPDDAILVRTDEDKHKYRNIFDSTFIFTIEEAKGLEFETVFLLEFFLNRQSVWNKVFNSNQLPMGTDIPELRLELNLLYVAVTRARRILNIWETNPSVFWSEDELINFIQPIAPEEIRKNQVDQNFQMWVSRGIYYRDNEFYAQAIECFEKAGEERLKLEVQVKLWLRERNYSKAAEGLVELKNWKQAAQVFEKLKNWNRAAECWSEAGNSANQKKSEAKQFEAKLCWEEAALLWDELGFEEDAKRCRGCRDRRIDFSKSFNGVNEKETLAREFEKTQYWEEAALLWDELSFEEDAKRCWNNRKIEIENVEIYTKVANHINRGLVLTALGNYEDAFNEYCKAVSIDRRGKFSNQHAEALLNKAIANYALDPENKIGVMQNLHSSIRYNPEYLEAYFFRGLVWSNKKKAISDFDQVIGVNPYHIEAFFNRGLAYAALYENKKAISDFDQVIGINPYHIEAFFNRGLAYAALYENKKAISDFDQVIGINPYHVEAFFNRGLAYAALYKNKKAISDFDQVSKINPRHLELYRNRGMAWCALGNIQGAIADFNQAILINPNDGIAYINRGFAYLALHDKETVISDCSRAIIISSFYEKYINKAFDISSFGDILKIIRENNQLLKVNPLNEKAYCERGVARSCLVDIQGAVEDYNQAININPNFAEAFLNRGLTLFDFGKGNIGRAIDDYTQAIQINPNFDKAYKARAKAFLESGDIEGAINDYSQVIQINPNDEEAYTIKAKAFLESGDIQGAIDNYSQVIKINPNNEEVYKARGKAFLESGDIEGAINDYSQVIKINPNEEVYKIRAKAFLESGDIEGAINDYSQVIKINPNEEVYKARGKARLDIGDIQGAIQDFSRLSEVNLSQVDVSDFIDDFDF